jgi:hypothetical protein
MSLLEEKIKQNREMFDGAEPSEGHLRRFQARLDFQRDDAAGGKKYQWGRFLRVAAVVIVLLSISVIYYLVNPIDRSSSLNASTLPQEVQEARMYYNKLTKEKLQQINECASSGSEASFIQKVALDEINTLDSSSIELEKQLQGDSQDQRLINALIRNYKTKSDLLDDILNRLCHI